MQNSAARSAEVKPPAALDAAEREAWRSFQAATPSLARAFFAPSFAVACGRAWPDARVAVIREKGEIAAFFPFQFAGPWHRRLGLAERIGGAMSDHSGIVARPGFRIAPGELLRLCGIGALFIDHLSEGQAAFGLAAEESETGHLIDLANGPDAYLTALTAADRRFVADTERRLRRLEKDFGAVRFAITDRPAWDDVAAVIAAKRAQYERTGAGDVFAAPERVALLRALVEEREDDCLPLLATLSAGERVLARHLGLLHAGCLSYWFPVYDPAARAVSPGRILLWQTILAAGRHGIVLIDRGAGDSQAKRDFSTREQRFGRAMWQAGGLRAFGARALQSLAWRFGR
jgi:CelD/BcsL family acetyltransferase involved in cellulose biosynthesis